MNASHRIGVFLCGCAENIGGSIDLQRIHSELKDTENVVFVVQHTLLCSPDGRATVTATIKQHAATHCVIAACSPKDHELTFRTAIKEAGLDPFMLQMANIREHCTWVTPDRDNAQQKATAMIRAAIRRVRLHEALPDREIEANADILVIGGGIAGIEAALQAAQADRNVTLVERSPSIGGRVCQFEEVGPHADCAPCLMSPRLSAVQEHPRIRLLTCSQVESMVGFLGNFTATIHVQSRQVDSELCIGCDECMQVCPAETKNAFDEGLSRRKAIYVPFPGATPNCAMIDRDACVRKTGETCTSCQLACPMSAIDFNQPDQTVEVKVGSVIIATGFDPIVPTDVDGLGHGVLPDVYTLLEFERLTSASGPTQGKIVKRDGQAPARMAIVHCVGRKELGYCSGFCCGAALLAAPLVKHQQLDCEVIHLCSELVLPGPQWATSQHRAEQAGARIVLAQQLHRVSVEHRADSMRVVYIDTAGNERTIDADMIVLATGMRPAAASTSLGAMLGLVQDAAGFIAPDHPMLRPAAASLDGVYIAGCAGGPKSIADSVAHAHAAAGNALARLQPGKLLRLENMTAQTVDAQCSGCLVCVAACPYQAPTLNRQTGLVEVNEALCRGCGACAAGCPSGAVRARHFSDDQLYTEIREVLHG